MKKRGYVLVYTIFILALLFMVVLTVTDSKMDRANLSTYISDYNNLKYKAESDSYLAIDSLINTTKYKHELLRLAREVSGGDKASLKMSLNSLIDGKKFLVTIEKDSNGYTNLEIKNSDKGIILNSNGKVRLYNDLFYKETLLFNIDSVKEDYETIFNSELIDGYLDKMIFMDQNIPVMIRNNYSYIEYAELKELTTNIENDDIEKKDKEKSDITEYEEEAEIDNLDETAPEESLDQESEEITDEEQEDIFDIKESEQAEDIMEDDLEGVYEDDSEITHEEVSEAHNTVDEELEFHRIDKDVIKEFVIGPFVHYRSDKKILLPGIITIDENTIIESDIKYSGILIIKGLPKHIRGNITIEGAIFTDVELPTYITHINKKFRFEKYASIFTGFFNPKVVELYYFY